MYRKQHKFFEKSIDYAIDCLIGQVNAAQYHKKCSGPSTDPIKILIN